MPPRNAQYSVGGGASLGSAALVNPSLLAMFERPLRPSLHLGLTVCEAALLESSSRALSESLSHSMWLLSLSDSARAEVRHMYQYLVDLFPQAAGSSQAPPPPHALFEEFFAAPSSPHQPVFLTWFERVRSTLAEADSRITSLLASGRPVSRLCLLVTLSIS